MNKLNIILDSSYFFYKNLYVVTSAKHPLSEKFGDHQNDLNIFIKRIIDDIKSTISLFPYEFISNIIWIQDSTSWRKDHCKTLPYKGTRVKDETNINFKELFKIYEEFSNHLNEHNFIVSRIYKAEADDLIYLWSNYLYDLGQSSVIVASDKDFQQCLKFENNKFIALYNNIFKSRKVTFHNSVNLNNDVDLNDDLIDFDQPNLLNSFVTNLTNNAIEIKTVDPNYCALVKIFTGDKGDNVPSLITWKTNSKNYGITEKMTQTLLSEHKNILINDNIIYNIYNDAEMKAALAEGALKLCNKHTTSKDEVINRINENIELMYLSNFTIPYNIQDQFKNSINIPEKNPKLIEDKIFETFPHWKSNLNNTIQQSDIFDLF